MVEEEVVADAETHVPSDLKRRLEDLEPEAPESVNPRSEEPVHSNVELDTAKTDSLVTSDQSGAKRPRLDEIPGGLANENGHQEVVDGHVKEKNDAQETVKTNHLDEAPNQADVGTSKVNNEQPLSTDNHEKSDSQELPVKNSMLDKSAEDTKEDAWPPSDEAPQQSSLNCAQEGDDSSDKDQQPIPANLTSSQKVEVPNNKVGVLIGKAGETIRYLQYNSGAKIQITKDADADPHSATRLVEIIGTLDSINKAEKLMNAVIEEADAGGSPSLIARGITSAQTTSVGEQIQIQVPNEKVGFIIGRGGETIKALQTRSGARIQLIPQHPPEGDESKERTVRVTGDRKQIEIAREMIKDVMNQTLRPYQPNYRSRGPPGQPQWSSRGSRGPHVSQPTSYDYHQWGPYPSHSPQHSRYGGYHQQIGPRSGFGSGWEQRPPSSMQGLPPHGSGYDYYNGHGGHLPEGPVSSQHSAPPPGHVPGPSPNAPAVGPPQSQVNYNYGHPQGSDYGHPVAPYSQYAHPQQNYGHGYDEPKYDSHATLQHPPYGGHGGSQPGYSNSAAQSGYGPQSQYGRPPSYGMPSQGPSQQSYGPPRTTSQPGDVPYQGFAAAQSYGQNVPPQQPYPYASSASTQQTYPPYGSTPTAEGYNQPPPSSVSGYVQQGGQPVASYSQSGLQQAPGYAQATATAGYVHYPSTQQGYPDQSAANAAAYGYQAPQDPSYSGGAPASAYTAAPTGQPGYAQPTTQNYDQSVQQSGTYGAPTNSSVAYGKTVSPQPVYPQYDSTQMYAAPAHTPTSAPAPAPR